MKGKLTSWRDDKGFGFIQTDELAKDVFIHISSLNSMPRKPKVGDIIQFELEQQQDGKNRAVNCRIEGLQAIKHSASKKPRAKPQVKKTAAQNRMIMKLWPVVLLVIMALTVDKLAKRNDDLDTKAPTQTASATSPSGNRYAASTQGNTQDSTGQSSKYKCDGRQYCNQMNSIEEAIFFTKYCPNTKMDGDNDGIPCERDSRLR